MTLIVDKSLYDYLTALRGRVTLSATGYPDSIHLHVKDTHGKVWKFFTWDADWEPTEPEQFGGRTLEHVHLDEQSGVTSFLFEHGQQLVITPGEYEDVNDPPYWEILTPDGQSVEYGPGPSWHVSDARVSPRTRRRAA